jgi:hypothetical protein
MILPSNSFYINAPDLRANMIQRYESGLWPSTSSFTESAA